MTRLLPEGEGRTLLLRACVSCHDLGIIVSQRKTAAGWRRSVDEMIRLGTRLTADEAEVVAKYLAMWFGPDAPVPETRQGISTGDEGSDKGRWRLPEGEGRALILQACVQCHDLRIIVSQRKTAAGWRRTVNEMIWRGAPLVADEAEVITNYLATSFNLDASTPGARK